MKKMDLEDDQIKEQQSHILNKEQTLFNLSNDFVNTLIYFELNNHDGENNSDVCIDNKLNEKIIREKLNSNESIQNLYFLNGDRSILISTKSEQNLIEIENLVHDIFEKKLLRKQIPYTNLNTKPLYLVSEINDLQLSIIDADKFSAIKFIEAKTGLKLKKIKKTIYFCGLLFQFLLLDEILNEKLKQSLKLTRTVNVKTEENIILLKERHLSTSSSSSSKENNCHDWHLLYEQSEIKYNFKLKPKSFDEKANTKAHSTNVNSNEINNKFEYDIYIFQADLTDLNTDALVNASNPDLHPGYDGDGISRRIREKGGKQMHDACKSIIKNERKNVLLKDSEVVYTKSYGKLKSKYVLHSVAPTWTKYITALDSDPEKYEKFEPLLEQTFINILKIAHDSSKMKLNSIAFPVSSSNLGGAFDVPIELWAHTLYTQLVDFELSHQNENTLKTICITSIEPETVKQLCDMFENYYESYSESSWAMPLSPMNKLLEKAIEHKPIPPPKPPKARSPSPPKQKLSPEKPITILQRPQQSKTNVNDDIKINITNNITSNKQITISFNEKHNNQNVLETSSSSSSGSNRSIDLTNEKDNINKISEQPNILYCCLFCQKESKVSLTMCGNQNCKASYCDICIYKFLSKQNSKKCPSCHNEIVRDILIRINNSNNRSSSSSSVSPTRLNDHHNNHHGHHQHININNNNRKQNFNNNSDLHTNSHKQSNNGHKNFHSHNNQVTDGKIYVRKLDDPCEGYEHFKSLLITFEVPDGIQTEHHPKPGHPYKGTIKRAYLPDIREHMEILSFYEKALKSGLLFKVEWNKNFGDYRVHLNQDILLKTKQFGGGKFGYPDPNYIDNLVKMARNFK